MAIPNGHDARDGGHVFTRIGSGNQPTRTTRSWTSNGVNYTVNTTSWSSPGLSFGATTGSAMGGLGRSFTTPGRPAVRSGGGGGLFGTAFGLLDDLLSVQPQRHSIAQGNMGQNPSGRRRVHMEVESDTDDDDLAYEYEDGRRSKGMFSRLKDRILDGKQKPRQREYSHSREQSPARRPRADRRHSSYRTETREPSLPQERGRPSDRFVEVDYEEDSEEEDDYPSQRPRRDSPMNSDMIEALENAVEVERQQVRACKRHLEQATRQPAISSHYLQRLVDELKGHETALTDAQSNLDEAKAKRRSTMPPRPASYHQSHPTQAQQRQSARNLDDEFFGPFGGGFSPFFGQSNPRASQPDPLFQAFNDMHSFDSFGRGPFGAFDQLFEQMHPGANDAHFRFFTNAGPPPPNSNNQRKRTRFSMPNGGTQFPNSTPQFTSAPPPPPPQPPAKLLRPDEAKRLFKTYNERWNAISTTDPNIPYPSRGLQASALSARDSIWAPTCSASISTWSEETVMQANAQAFYLGVVGLVPVYTEAPGTGRIEMGFDKSKANPAQVKVLVDMLKKEKMRWHSDRLGRRNGGAIAAMGPNEALQKDERARAVFHAVCELMESAQ